MAGVVLAERYRLDGVLGEGGMAVVFDGHHLGLDRSIAIKVLRPEFVADAQIRARFEQEARAVSRLEHPGIVKMFDVGTAEVPGLLTPIAFLVMERLRGVELSDLLRDDGPAPASVALGWLEEMLAAITHAHARGVVHRDLKPENVFACESPDGGRVLKLVDFGIAKMVQPRGDEPLTQMGMIFGTPAYMSPEQATGQPVDGRTDLYSAGIILFEMLSGAVPFAAAEMMEVLRQQVRDPAPKLPVAAPVAAILDRLLAKSPEDRYPDAQTALEAVREAKAAVSESGPTAPKATDAAKVGTPTAAAIHETLEAPAAQTPRSPAAPTAPAIHESVGDTRARLEVSAEPPSPTPEPSFPARRVVLVGAALTAAAILVLIVSGTFSGSSVAPGELQAAVAFPVAPTRAAPEALASIDAKLDAKDRSAARDSLAPLLEAFPEDPAVAWRAALAQDNPRGESEARAELLLRAIRLDPNRLEDTSAQASVLRELERAVVSEALLTLVLDYGEPMREDWIRALLGGKRPAALPHAQRHRLLDALSESTDGATTSWDPVEHLCHDLWQAGRTDRACTVYADTLDAMESAPSASYRRTLAGVEVPVAGPAEKAAACAELKARRDTILESISGAEGDPEFIPREYAARAKGQKQTPTRKKRRRGKIPRPKNWFQ